MLCTFAYFVVWDLPAIVFAYDHVCSRCTGVRRDMFFTILMPVEEVARRRPVAMIYEKHH
jgi:hypothetical protein